MAELEEDGLRVSVYFLCNPQDPSATEEVLDLKREGMVGDLLAPAKRWNVKRILVRFATLGGRPVGQDFSIDTGAIRTKEYEPWGPVPVPTEPRT